MWRGLLLYGLWGSGSIGSALTNWFAASLDMNTAMRDYLNAHYSTSNSDLAPLLARYFNERTNVDTVAVWSLLVQGARGQIA